MVKMCASKKKKELRGALYGKKQEDEEAAAFEEKGYAVEALLQSIGIDRRRFVDSEIRNRCTYGFSVLFFSLFLFTTFWNAIRISVE